LGRAERSGGLPKKDIVESGKQLLKKCISKKNVPEKFRDIV